MRSLLRTKPTDVVPRRRVILTGEGNLFQRIRRFLAESWAEFRLAQRPTKQEVISYSMAVLMVILASALYLAILDFVFGRILLLLSR